MMKPSMILLGEVPDIISAPSAIRLCKPEVDIKIIRDRERELRVTKPDSSTARAIIKLPRYIICVPCKPSTVYQNLDIGILSLHWII